MRNNLLALFAGAAMMVALPAFAANNNAAEHSTASLLNQATQINKSEEDMAGMLNNKAGDNLALTTLAKTLKADHQTNQAAVKSLADQQNITLKSYQPDQALKNKMDNLNGRAFDKAFLDHEAMDHRQALDTFQNARNETNNHEVRTYIDETIPVLKAHLKMVENLQQDLGFSSSQNSANTGNYQQTSRR